MSASEPMRADTPRLARATAVMAVGTVASRATGFLRVAALATAFGVTESRLADAYNIANVAPNIVYELVLGGVLSSVLVPLFVETRRRDADEHRTVVNTITTLATLVLLAIVVVTVAAAPLIAHALTLRTGADAASLAVTRSAVTTFLRLFMPQVLFYGLTTIWTAYLNSHEHFAAPMFAPVLNNLVVSAVAFGFGAAVGFRAVDLAALSAAQTWLIGGGTTLGIVAMTLPLWPVARRHGWRWRPQLDWRHPTVRRMGRLGGWVILYVVINQVGYYVVVLLTGAVALKGSFTAYSYAFVFFQLPHGIYAVSVMTALLPTLSAAASDGDLAAFRAQLARGIRVTAMGIVPAAVGLAVLSVPIVRLLLQHGVFSASSTTLVAHTLTAFAVGLTSFSLFQLALRAHYALQDTRTPTVVNVLAVGTNVVVDVIVFAVLPTDWKVPGLALGHATAYTVGTVLFLRRLRRRVGGLEGRRTLGQLGRVVAASAVTGVVAWVLQRLVVGVLGAGSSGAAVALVVAAGGGALAYLVVARLVGVAELGEVVGMLRRRGGAR